MRLVACPACSRHVRATEKVCAFCGETFDGGSNGARFAMAVALVAATAVMGCEGQREIAQPYGVPMPPNDGRDAAANPIAPVAPTSPANADAGAPIVGPTTK